MMILVIFWIFLLTSILGLCCVSALSGAADRIRKDENYSFKKLYEGREQQKI